MIKQNVFVIFLSALVSVSCINGYFDNRYLFPLNERLTWRTPNKLSRLSAGVFFMTGDGGRDENGDDIRLPQLGGCFDMYQLNCAMDSAGIENPKYLTEWDAVELPYVVYGKLGSTGFDFALEYGFNKHLALGAALSLMHVNTRYNFYISKDAIKNLSTVASTEVYSGRQLALEQARLNANKLLGLNAGQWSKTGLSDTELYVRAGTIEDYVWKFQQVDASIWLGAILPTGTKRSIYAPSSIPFGGNGHYGMFVRGEIAVELTDDAFVGLWLYSSKRFSKRQLHRMPLSNEALQYGVIVDNATVDPGFTFGISPYGVWDDIENGFGAYAAYTVIHHMNDDWRYTGDCSPNIRRLYSCSSWTNEFFTLGIDYDFTKTNEVREYGPRIYLDMAWPSNVFDARNVAKTHKVSLGIEFHF